jgi:hypothetical protein
MKKVLTSVCLVLLLGLIVAMRATRHSENRPETLFLVVGLLIIACAGVAYVYELRERRERKRSGERGLS